MNQLPRSFLERVACWPLPPVWHGRPWRIQSHRTQRPRERGSAVVHLESAPIQEQRRSTELNFVTYRRNLSP